jgi:hypothetical protein
MAPSTWQSFELNTLVKQLLQLQPVCYYPTVPVDLQSCHLLALSDAAHAYSYGQPVRTLVLEVGKWPSMAPSNDWVKWAVLGYSAHCGKSEIRAKFPPTLILSLDLKNVPPPLKTE